MKKFILYLLFAFVLNISVKAQDKNYTQTVDSLFVNLNKSEITTGILYDRVFPFAGLDIFNVGASDTSSNSHFSQAYLELFNSSYNNAGMTSPDAIDAFKKIQIYNGVVPIGLLNYNYHLMDTLAQDNNLISASGLMLYDVAGRNQSPYLLKNTTVAAILADTINNSSVNFEVYSSTYLQNTSLGISNLQIDFGDGTGLHQINMDQPVTINYSSSGLKIVRYIITYSNTQQVVTYSQVYINNDNSLARSGSVPNNAICNGVEHPQTLPIEADISYQGYEEGAAFKGQGTATIYYHDNDCDRVLKKPIIILDGFDPGSVRYATQIYNLLEYNNGIINNANLAKELINKGYDVIILDYPQYPINGKMIDGGSDYIQRNAFTLIKLIQTINDMKASGADDLIVVGPSMGGLITRYALTYMEHHNMPHHTKLWVSFDAPQLGANIPIGDQWMLKYLAVDFGNGDAKMKLNDKINTAAAKEMILHHYLSSQQSPTPHFTRNLFVQELANLGYPVGDPGYPIRNIALANGSGIGALKNSFGSVALQFSEQPTTGFRIVAGVATLLSPKRLIWKIIKIIGIASGVIQAGTTGIIDTKVWFTSGYNGSNKVFEGTMFSGMIQSRKYFAGTPANSIGLDNASGGVYDTQKQIKDGLNDALNHGLLRLIYKPVYNTFIPDHSFIPVKSSLAVTSVSNFGDDFSNRNLVTTGETPFNSYFTPELNEGHVTLTDCSAKWLTMEIDGQPQSPIGIKYSISGPSSLCSVNNTYSIANLPSGVTVNWNIEGYGSYIVSSSGNQVTVAKDGYGIFKVKAVVTTACGDISIESGPVTAGMPYSVNDVQVSSNGLGAGPGILCNHQYDYDDYVNTFTYALNQQPAYPITLNYYIIDPANGSTLFSRSVSITSQTGTYSLPASLPVGYYNLEVRVSGGPCNESSEWYEVGMDYANCGSRMVAYPNPVNTELTVSQNGNSEDNFNKQGQTSAPVKVFEVKLYDNKGKVLRSAKNAVERKDIVIDTRDIQNGTYFLHIIQGKEIIKKQIVVQH